MNGFDLVLILISGVFLGVIFVLFDKWEKLHRYNQWTRISYYDRRLLSLTKEGREAWNKIDADVRKKIGIKDHYL